MGTMLCGVFASENLDTHSEKIDIKGLDLSTIAIDGTVNWDHKKDLPSQIVGRVKMAKAIYSEADCSNELELKYFHKVGLPMVFGICELFDSEGHHEAQNLVAMLRNDQKSGRPIGERNLINFSIDGQVLEKTSTGVITHCIGRDVAVSIRQANKQATAEEYLPEQKFSPLDAIKTLFKNENNEGEVLSELDAKIIHLEALLKSDDISEFAKAKITEHLSKVKPQEGKVAPIQKEVNGRPSANLNRKPILPPKESLPWVPKASIAPRPKATPANPKGITSQAPGGGAKAISGNEFAQKIKAFKEKAAQSNLEAKAPYKGKLSSKTSIPTVEPKIESPKTVAPTIAAPKTVAPIAAPKIETPNGEPKPTHFEVKSKAPKLDAIRAKTGPIMIPMSKAETAGTIVGPGSNTGFAALAGSNLKKQADDIYNKWDKKEDFEQFLSSRLPKLSKNEIKALAKMYSVATMQKKEEILKDI